MEMPPRVALIGPLPPPINGQTRMMQHICDELESRGLKAKSVDTGHGNAPRGFKHLLTLGRAVRSLWSIPGSDSVYIAVKAGKGMWLTTAAAGLARLFRTQLVLHHHSYAYVSERKLRMVALARVAGTNARHVVLSHTMEKDFVDTMPEIHSTLVCTSAWSLNRALLDLPLRSQGSELVLGHLSILTPEKGIGEVVDLALALDQARTNVRLLIGGPSPGRETRAHFDRAARELGDRFEYRGPLQGDAKLAFFGEITHFVFPSRYAHEAVPMVLYEAMAAGAVCVATGRGSIPEQLQDSPAVLANNADSFVQEVLPSLVGAPVSSDASRDSRHALREALTESESHLNHLVDLLAQRPSAK